MGIFSTKPADAPASSGVSQFQFDFILREVRQLERDYRALNATVQLLLEHLQLTVITLPYNKKLVSTATNE